MYEKLRAKPREKKEWALRVLLSVTAALLIVCLIGTTWAVSYHLRYRDFVSRLSESVTYAYSHHSLHGDAGEEQPVWVKGEHVYQLYNYILVSGEGKVIHTLPEEAPGIDLDFGDGSRLRVWGGGTEDTILCYSDAEGQYAFAAKSVSMETMQINMLSLSGNIAWTGE